VGIYGMIASELGFYTKAMLSIGYFDNDHTRYAMGQRVQGKYSAAAMGVGAELGFKKYIGSLSINPFVSVDYDRIRQSSYSENNFTWGNRYYTESADSVPVALGFRLEGNIVNDLGFVVKPRLKYSYITETQTDRNITMSPLSSPACHCNIDGVSAPSHMQYLELGLKAQLTQNLEINANAIGRWANDSRSLGGGLGLNYSF
jgi:outer membrane autotransporter protein